MRAVLILWAAALAAQTRDITIAGANVLRADRKTDLIAGDRRVEIRRGKVTYYLFDSGAPPVEIATPTATIHPYFTGEYRIEVKGSGETVVTPLRGGDVKVTGPQYVYWVPVGRKAIAAGKAGNARLRVVSAISGWHWVGRALAEAARNGSVSVDAGSSTTSDDSAPAAHPASPHSPPAASPPSSVSAGANNTDSRPGSHSSHGK